MWCSSLVVNLNGPTNSRGLPMRKRPDRVDDSALLAGRQSPCIVQVVGRLGGEGAGAGRPEG